MWYQHRETALPSIKTFASMVGNAFYFAGSISSHHNFSGSSHPLLVELLRKSPCIFLFFFFRCNQQFLQCDKLWSGWRRNNRWLPGITVLHSTLSSLPALLKCCRVYLNLSCIATLSWQAFMNAWKACCADESHNSALVIPQNRTFLLKPLQFSGPCKSSNIHLKVKKTKKTVVYIL